MEVQNAFRGCLIGGGLGDALGYPVEFLSLSEIKRKYGEAGLRELASDDVGGKALISDDTQMSLFTASGLLLAKHRMATMRCSISDRQPLMTTKIVRFEK